MKETSLDRIPLLQDHEDAQPFVFYNTDLHRIEFVHGNTTNIIQLAKGTPITVEPTSGTSGLRIGRENEVLKYDGHDHEPIQAWKTTDHGTALHDSRGHIFCSIKENGPDDDIIITVKRKKRYYYISFPYSPYQIHEERVSCPPNWIVK